MKRNSSKEAIDAKHHLDENEGTVIEDSHEDEIIRAEFDIDEKHSSFKQEFKPLEKKHKDDLKTLEDHKKQEMATLGSDFKSKEWESKAHKIEAKYKKILVEYEKAYNEAVNKLKEKYHDELAYHIKPKLKRRPDLMDTDVILSVRNLKQFFFFGSKIKHQKLKAVSNVSFDVKKGECFGIVGESGCGKTTTGRTIIKLYKPTSGSIYYKGYRIGAGPRWNQKEIKWTRKRAIARLKSLYKEKKAKLKALDKNNVDYKKEVEKINSYFKKESKIAITHYFDVRKVQKGKIKQIRYDMNHTPKKLMNEIQMIFQDPVDSLDPRMTVEDIIQEGLVIQGHHNKKENHKKVVEMLEKVGLVEEHASRYPHEFSGGQRQRIGIARALAMNPKLLICDEPISALDVSIRAQIINLLNDLKDDMGLTLIFIAHDLSVVKYFCDRIAVMYFGKLVELADSDELFKHPLHPYTVSLLSAIPKPNPLTERERIRIVYRPWEVHDYTSDKPTLKEVCPGHFVYCNDKEFKEHCKKIAEIDAQQSKSKKQTKVSKEK